MAGSVLVVGSGLAGCIAAINAARSGARVTLASAGQLFGGSSFYPGTWGLGLIGPESRADEDDLVSAIEEVGSGVADPALVKAFVRGISPSLQWLEGELGLKLKRPANREAARETAFIPCFDRKHRTWRGLTREPLQHALGAQIDRLGIMVLERHELMGLLRQDDGAVAGAVLFDHVSGSLVQLPAGATVLASGGTGGLFERSLTSADVLSSVHGIAMEAGCQLVNIEFMQMMPALVSPKRGLVFNEKTFRYARLLDGSGILPSEPKELADLLECRSGHGPFTSRLGDQAVDLAIDAAGPQGIEVRYDFPRQDVPEFVRTFAEWLRSEHGISTDDSMRVCMYAHAANGGIRIDAQGGTGVAGLFACGELTGGMHGADRIGGLSSANGLVFGRAAGAAAARYAAKVGSAKPVGQHPFRARPLDSERACALTARMRSIMSERCMIKRTEAGLTSALRGLEALQGAADGSCWGNGAGGADDASLARGIRLRSQLSLAHAMVSAMRDRRESLGSHYRADFPPPGEG